MTRRINGENGITLDECLQNVPGTKGIYTNLAKKLGLDRTYVSRLAKKWSTLAEVMLQEKKTSLDTMECKGMEMAEEGSERLIMYFLSSHRAPYNDKPDVQQNTIILKSYLKDDVSPDDL